GSGEPLAAERGGEEQREQGKRREDERGARGGDEAEPVVQQRNQDAELHDAEEADAQEVTPVEARPRGGEREHGEQAREPDDVGDEREGGGPRLIDDEPRRDHGRADLDAGGGRGQRGEALHDGGSTRSAPDGARSAALTAASPTSRRRASGRSSG